MLSTVKWIVIAIILVGIGAGLWYVTNLKADLAISEQNNKKLEEGVKAQNALIEQMQADVKLIQETNEKLKEENEKQKQDVDALAKKFDKRDFGVFAAAQPKKTEDLINRGTKNALRCLELASGAPLNETEKNAKTAIEANRECPALVDPNYKSVAN
jgi:type II secretory pathway component PulC